MHFPLTARLCIAALGGMTPPSSWSLPIHLFLCPHSYSQVSGDGKGPSICPLSHVRMRAVRAQPFLLGLQTQPGQEKFQLWGAPDHRGVHFSESLPLHDLICPIIEYLIVGALGGGGH